MISINGNGFMFSKAELFKAYRISNKILNTPYNPRKYITYGRDIDNFDETVWNSHKTRIMFEHVKHKFLQNSELRKELLDTSSKIIVSAFPSNSVWSIGTANQSTKIDDIQKWGSNMLGNILTNLRNSIQLHISNKYLKKSSGRLVSDHNSSKKSLEQFDPTELDWDYYVGSKYHRMFAKLKLEKDSTVLEIGPGSVSKVGEGLKQYGFIGKIVLVEPELNSLQEISKKYKLLMPKATVIEMNMTLNEYLQNQCHNSIDVVVSNHVIDDMIIGKYISSKQKFTEFFQDHYTEPDIQKTSRLWEELTLDVGKRLQITEETIIEWINVMKLSKATIISAYDSYLFRVNENRYPSINHAHTLSQGVLKKIKESLELSIMKEVELEKDDVIQSTDFWICAKKI